MKLRTLLLQPYKQWRTTMQLDQDALITALAAYDDHGTEGDGYVMAYQRLKGMSLAIQAYLATANKLRPIESAPIGKIVQIYTATKVRAGWVRVDDPRYVAWMCDMPDATCPEECFTNISLHDCKGWLPLPVVEGV
jgi:hypothetical protein